MKSSFKKVIFVYELTFIEDEWNQARKLYCLSMDVNTIWSSNYTTGICLTFQSLQHFSKQNCIVGLASNTTSSSLILLQFSLVSRFVRKIITFLPWLLSVRSLEMPQINFVHNKGQAKRLRHYSFLLHLSSHSDDVLKTACEAGSKGVSRREKIATNQ